MMFLFVLITLVSSESKKDVWETYFEQYPCREMEPSSLTIEGKNKEPYVRLTQEDQDLLSPVYFDHAEVEKLKNDAMKHVQQWIDSCEYPEELRKKLTAQHDLGLESYPSNKLLVRRCPNYDCQKPNDITFDWFLLGIISLLVAFFLMMLS